MTRAEAIKFLTLMRKAVSNFEEYGHDKASMVIECDKAEAIDMAIEALQAEETIVIQTGQTHGKSAYIKELAEVVRCKDCRYRNGKVNRKGFEICDATGMDITDNDFCSWGERREP